MEPSSAPVPTPPRALRTAGLYLLLVIVPAMGVGTALYVGRGLVAPPSVGGAWRVAPDRCERAAGALTIAQSGRCLLAEYTRPGLPVVRLQGRLGADGRFSLEGPAEGCERVEAAAGGAPLQATVRSGACGCRTSEAALARDTLDVPAGH